MESIGEAAQPVTIGRRRLDLDCRPALVEQVVPVVCSTSWRSLDHRWITWERVSRGVPEEDAPLLAEEVRHQAEPDVARNLGRRLPPSTLPDVSLTPVASMTSVRRGV